MRTLTQHLTQYAAYHRDRRNIATHFIGIPMIVFATAILLARPAFAVAGVTLSPVWIVSALLCAFYLKLDLRLGALMTALMGAAAWGAGFFAAQSTAVWLGAGLGGFVLGWFIQFVGHYYEGRKPAFVDDLVGFAIGPLFVVSEVVFALGLRREVLQAIEAKVGPTRIRVLGQPVGPLPNLN